MKDIDRKLTPKQEMFCREYLTDLNGTQAAIRAGYSLKTANEQAAQHLAKVSVQSRIKELITCREIEIQVTAGYVLKGIIETVSEAREHGELNTALRGYELLGRHLGMFNDKLSVKMMTLEELVAGAQ